jgi:hypothetical protein
LPTLVRSKSASPSAIQLKNWQKAIDTEEKLGIINCNVRLASSGVHTVCDNADRI